MTSSHPWPVPCQWFSSLAAVLARGRRTGTSSIRAAKLGDEYQSCDTAVAATGKETDSIAARLVTQAVKPMVSEAHWLTLALNDTPTKRYGPHVQGAGVHHNPTPGPVGSVVRVPIYDLERNSRPAALPTDGRSIIP